MPDHKKKKKTLQRILKWALLLVLLGIIGLVVWTVLVPMITAGAVTTYDSYTVTTGDISTTKSFSATLSVKKSETFSSEEECTVREIYVQSGDAVKKGDQLILLSTGELFTASFDGVINEIRVKQGDWLWPNFNVVQVSDLEHLEVAISVDEYDVEGLSLGQACTVSVISLGVDFDTVIAHINRVSQSTGTVAFYSVTCDLTVPENILPGMQATVTLPDQTVQGVTMVDMAAIAFDDNKQAYVLVKDASGNYQHQLVETGLSDGMSVEIKSGLTGGQTVYAVSGSESANTALTLNDIYKAIFGQKTVINDMSSPGGLGERPEGAPDRSGGGQAPTDGQTAAGGQAPTDGQTAAGGHPPTDGQTVTDGQSATDGQTATGGQITGETPAATADTGENAQNTTLNAPANDQSANNAANAQSTTTPSITLTQEEESDNAQ